MTRHSELKERALVEIRERVMAHFDLNPHLERDLYLEMTNLALSHYTLSELWAWLAILNRSATLTSCKSKEG
jgi:hypothetical protein